MALGLHMITVVCWIGGGVSLFLLYFLKLGVDDPGLLYGINQTIHFLDMKVVVIPGALGCLATGLVYRVFTKWFIFNRVGSFSSGSLLWPPFCSVRFSWVHGQPP